MALPKKVSPDAKTDPNSIPNGFQQRDKASEYLIVHTKVDELRALIELGEVPPDAIKRLISSLAPYQEVSFDEDFSVRDELAIQMKLVSAVRLSILQPNGEIKKETTVTEVKSVLDASMRLADMLNKVNKELVNQERLQAVEAAFMDVVNSFGKEDQLQFIESLERRMKVQKALKQA